MALKLTLAKRAGQIGPSVNTRTEKHGEEDVPGIDIPISGIFLDREELNAVLQDEAAHDALFTTSRSKATEPRFQGIAPLALEDKFEDAKVTILVDEEEPLILKLAKVSKIRLEPQIGGLTAMSCTIQGNPSDHIDVLGLLNSKCRITILNAKLAEASTEPELDLAHKDQKSDTEDPPKRTPKGKSRRRADVDG